MGDIEPFGMSNVKENFNILLLQITANIELHMLLRPKTVQQREITILLGQETRLHDKLHKTLPVTLKTIHVYIYKFFQSKS